RPGSGDRRARAAREPARRRCSSLMDDALIPEDNRKSELPEVFAAPILAPMFPLQDVYLFPGTFIPLHIFEPRYRQMVEDSLDGPGRIVIASPLEDETQAPDAQPSVHPIAGLGEIARHERLEDGRFMIWL